MPLPADPRSRHEHAMTRAWACAERADELQAQNNGSSAMVWAGVSQAWALIASAAVAGTAVAVQAAAPQAPVAQQTPGQQAQALQQAPAPQPAPAPQAPVQQQAPIYMAPAPLGHVPPDKVDGPNFNRG